MAPLDLLLKVEVDGREQSSECKEKGGQHPGGNRSAESGSWKEAGAHLDCGRSAEAPRGKAAWSVAGSGSSRSLSSWPKQPCSRHSTMSLAGQGRLGRRDALWLCPAHTPLSTQGLLLPSDPRLWPGQPGPPTPPPTLSAPPPQTRLLSALLTPLGWLAL